MSELYNTHTSRDLRWQLLATVSALALTAQISSSGVAQADEEDAGRPTVWIELGGQAERMPAFEDRFAPPFTLRTPRPFFETVSPLSAERPPRYAVGGEGKLTFQPAGSDWVFNAAVRYGRSSGTKHLHNQVNLPTVVSSPLGKLTTFTPVKFEDSKSSHRETHTVLDFTVGKDVGLGLFGDAVASLGVRYAQFESISTSYFSSKPDHMRNSVALFPGFYLSKHDFHLYTAGSKVGRSFHGVGPSLSLSGDMPIAGKVGQNRLTLDWGMNGAFLFGRQRANVTDKTRLRHYNTFYSTARLSFSSYHHTHGRVAAHSVTVPNVGGFAGISYRFPNAKLSAGYRADFFFNAMDGGLDAPRSKTVSFHGPFATVSIGLGG